MAHGVHEFRQSGLAGLFGDNVLDRAGGRTRSIRGISDGGRGSRCRSCRSRLFRAATASGANSITRMNANR